MSFTWWWYPRRSFTIDGHPFVVAMTARSDGLYSRLTLRDVDMAGDMTPLFGPEAVRNHWLTTDFPDGRRLEIDAGYIGLWTTGIVARLDGRIVFESHPGRAPAFPEKFRADTIAMGGGGSLKATFAEGARKDGQDWSRWKANRLPLAVDIGTGLLFFVIAKLTDLQTAALVGVAIGIALVVFQHVTKIDVTGGLALFGIAMLCVSAGLAWWFADEEWIKQRSTIVGLLASSLFLLDGLLGGKRLASGLSRYMMYNDIDVGRLGIGMGVAGIVLAAANFLVARYTSTDVWLFYSTFLDVFVFIGLFFGVLKYARSGRPTA